MTGVVLILGALGLVLLLFGSESPLLRALLSGVVVVAFFGWLLWSAEWRLFLLLSGVGLFAVLPSIWPVLAPWLRRCWDSWGAGR